MHYAVFNGDADGIFSLHQLCLADRVKKEDLSLVTGVKRDIDLLKYISNITDSTVTVLDISLDKNRTMLVPLLAAGNSFLYIDHHFAGDIPDSPLLEHHIEPSADICTSLIVHSLVKEFPLWAICGAYGDNLHEQAAILGSDQNITSEQMAVLQELGELFNYNGYGSTLDDLLFHPADLYRAIADFSDPFDFYTQTDLVKKLRDGYEHDVALALTFDNISRIDKNRIYSFPAKRWARRIAGVFSNMKAREKKESAHAIIVENSDTTLQISVRAPLADKKNADTLCRKFPTGGGRAAAAGINNLPQDMLEDFIEAFHNLYS